MAKWVLFGTVLIAVPGCSQAPPPAEAAPSAISAIAKMGQLATDPIALFSLTFEGSPPPEEIREKLDIFMDRIFHIS